MSAKSNVVILGFMGTGKSAVGTRLADQVGKTFVDMDAVIEARAGKSISRIFAENGEPHFRALERALVQELAQGADQVIAAGGGVVLDPRNLDDFRRTSVLICLKASPQKILERVAAQTHRPLLEKGDKARQILHLLESRRPRYDAIEHCIDTTDLSVDEVVARAAEIAMNP
ncbi:MAG: shikimate kinase [Kiritimatiellae bacterium]|nr:shikimate kinase [Kiritimatiellia bacterium]